MPVLAISILLGTYMSRGYRYFLFGNFDDILVLTDHSDDYSSDHFFRVVVFH